MSINFKRVTGKGAVNFKTPVVAVNTNGSLQITGVGNYVTTNNTILPATQTTFTVEYWMYMTQLPTLLDPIAGAAGVGDMLATSGINYWSFGPRNTGQLCFAWYDGAVQQPVGNTTMSINTWYHVAASITSGTGNIKLFVNGNQQTISGTSTISNRAGTSGVTTIGQWNTSREVFYGYMSNIRIVSGTAVYTSNFTPPTSPLTAIAGTVLLMNTPNTVSNLVDSSSNHYTMTATGTVPSSSLNPF